MAWLQQVKEYKKSAISAYNVTQDQDLIENADCIAEDINRTSTRLLRLTVKKYQTSGGEYYGNLGGNIYVYIKLFKWDEVARNYLKQSQLAMTLVELKKLRESFGKVDAMIDALMYGPEVNQTNNQEQEAMSTAAAAGPPPPNYSSAAEPTDSSYMTLTRQPQGKLRPEELF